MQTGGILNAIAHWRWPGPEKTVTMDYIMENAQTGDVMLWSCSGSLWTPFWTDSAFSHVSLVYRSPRTGKLYQWQSTTHPKGTDLLTGEFDRNGVQLLDFYESTMLYAKKWGRLIAWRPIMYYDDSLGNYTRDLPQHAVDELNRGFEKTIDKTRGMDFDHDWRDMMGGRDFQLQYCPWPIGRPADFHGKIFCAALAAITLQEAGVLNIGYNAQNYSPAAFDSRSHQLFMRDKWGYAESLTIAFGENAKKADYQ